MAVNRSLLRRVRLPIPPLTHAGWAETLTGLPALTPGLLNSSAFLEPGRGYDPRPHPYQGRVLAIDH